MLATQRQPKAGREEKAARSPGVLQDGGPRRVLARAKIRAAYRRLVHFVRDEDGGPLVEFTLLTPLIFLTVFGVVAWGNLFFIRNSMFNAARLGARAAAVGAAANTLAGAVVAACAAPSPIAGTGYTYTFTYAYNTGCTEASSPSSPTWGTVTLTIAANVGFFNYKGLIPQNLTASATMQQEYVCPAIHNSATCTSTCAAAATNC
jgi:Flp pilus assembly protein TadG